MFGVQLHNGVPYHPSTPKKVWRKVRKTICVDSRDREIAPDSHPGSYTVTLPTVYQNIYAVTLRSIEIPFSFYTFTACGRNTSMNVTYNGSTKTITIPDGNYSGSLLASTVASLLNAELAPVNTTPFSASYNTATGKISIASNLVFSLVLDVIR